MAGNDAIMWKTSFNICMSEIKDVSKLLFMISPCCFFCSAKAQQMWKNGWLQFLFYNIKRELSLHRWLQLELRISFEKNDDRKCFFWRGTSTLDHYKWRPETMTVPFKCMAASAALIWELSLNRNICQIHCI